MNRYELKLQDGTVVSWTGDGGEDAAHRYAHAHPGATVVAWRERRCMVVSVHSQQIVP